MGRRDLQGSKMWDSTRKRPLENLSTTDIPEDNQTRSKISVPNTQAKFLFIDIPIGYLENSSLNQPLLCVNHLNPKIGSHITISQKYKRAFVQNLNHA